MKTVQLTDTMMDKLDAFQMIGLGHILKIEHAYYSGASNKEVYDEINIILNKGTDIIITWQEFIAVPNFRLSIGFSPNFSLLYQPQGANR